MHLHITFVTALLAAIITAALDENWANFMGHCSGQGCQVSWSAFLDGPVTTSTLPPASTHQTQAAHTVPLSSTKATTLGTTDPSACVRSKFPHTVSLLPTASGGTAPYVWRPGNASVGYSLALNGTGQPPIATASYTSLYFPTTEATFPAASSTAIRNSSGSLWVTIAQILRSLQRVMNGKKRTRYVKLD